MIRDLLGAGGTETTADVIIVGGGTVGLLTSVWLAEAGFNVVCLESGGLHQKQDEHFLNRVVHLRSHYDGAGKGRFRCLGGTSTRWGGALIPFQGEDLEIGDWPISIDALLPFVEMVEKEFGVTPGPYNLDELSSRTHTARLAKWPPFKRRNVYNLLRKRINALDNLVVWLNATVTGFSVNDNRFESLSARSPKGDVLKVSAPRVVIAAGAIETTRLSLLLNSQNDDVISNQSPVLGHYFSDHLSVVVGEMVTTKRALLNKHVGFRFEHDGTMRNLRFELSGDRVVRADTPASFGHIGFETDGQSEFDVLRNIFRSLQKREIPAFSDGLQLMKSAPWLLRAIWSRYVHKRLLFPKGAKLTVHMVIDQDPIAENRIVLSDQQQDIFSTPLAAISWMVTDKDKENLTRAVDAFERMWRNLELSSFAQFIRRPKGSAEDELVLGGGIYHPTGSTRMARSMRDGVVNSDLALFAIPNVQLLSTSVFPTGGGGNPTMMLLLFAARLTAQFKQRGLDDPTP